MTIFRRMQRAADWQVLLVLILIAIGSTIFSGFQNSDQFSQQWWSDFSQNFSTEMFGAFLTFLLLEKIVGSRNTEGRLIRELGSMDNATTLKALRELNEKGWDRDGTLKEAFLLRANLEGAILENANLQEAFLVYANLRDAQLAKANLQGAILGGANLQGADLFYANLQKADLKGVEFDEKTTLPDVTNWSPVVDMEKFTNPDHPDFWKPDWVKDK
ncbi:MAG: pentapeptide repeat-containing protein [Chloroflexi bacterium]|nr:pentapeptide repeat-containing protein [Chloroflexota bacterium]